MIYCKFGFSMDIPFFLLTVLLYLSFVILFNGTPFNSTWQSTTWERAPLVLLRLLLASCVRSLQQDSQLCFYLMKSNNVPGSLTEYPYFRSTGCLVKQFGAIVCGQLDCLEQSSFHEKRDSVSSFLSASSFARRLPPATRVISTLTRVGVYYDAHTLSLVLCKW